MGQSVRYRRPQTMLARVYDCVPCVLCYMRGCSKFYSAVGISVSNGVDLAKLSLASFFAVYRVLVVQEYSL